MASESKIRLTVSDFIAITNQTLEYAYPHVEIEGEVASFKVNQGKYVFFDIKDATGSIGCFMMLWQLRVPIEDGMQVVVSAVPKLTKWGKFSLTVSAIRLSGEGSLKKGFELLKLKLEREGLFSEDRKRNLPAVPRHVAIIASVQSAGYGDFVKVLNDRWGGLQIDVNHVQVQGEGAADQIISALKRINSKNTLPEVIIVIRGGGSADDLSTFNDEMLVRALATSRIPTLVGVGHEIDVTLADMVADVRAATPSNAAQLLVPDKNEIIRSTRQQAHSLLPRIERIVDERRRQIRDCLQHAIIMTDRQYERQASIFITAQRVLSELDPNKVLARGYALIRGKVVIGGVIQIEKKDIVIEAEIQNVRKK